MPKRTKQAKKKPAKGIKPREANAPVQDNKRAFDQLLDDAIFGVKGKK